MSNVKNSLFVFILAVTSMMFSSNSYGQKGGNSGGGGDPDAVDVLVHMRTFSTWAAEKKFPLVQEEIASVKSLVNKISLLMDDEEKTPIVMSKEMPVDKSGAPKPIYFTKEPLKILVHRESWTKFTLSKKIVNVGLEILGLLDIQDRYGLAGKIQESIGRIGNIKADEQLFQFMIGSWIADGNAMSCMSGSPINSGDGSSLAPYQFEFRTQYTKDKRFSVQLLLDGKKLATGSGTFEIQAASINAITNRSCRYDNDIEVCNSEPQEDIGQNLLTLQGPQFWVLYNQGSLGGACSPQDIFVVKYSRMEDKK